MVPGECMVSGGVWAWGVHGLGGLVSQQALRQTPPGETATAVDSMHPTGMHSCYTCMYVILSTGRFSI